MFYMHINIDIYKHMLHANYEMTIKWLPRAHSPVFKYYSINSGIASTCVFLYCL